MKAGSERRFIIRESATIEDALLAITENRHGAAVVADANNIFVGVVSDGDIRRAIVRGATTLAPITKCVNMNTVTLRKGAGLTNQSRQLFSEHPEITLIPVLDAHNHVRDVISRYVTEAASET